MGCWNIYLKLSFSTSSPVTLVTCFSTLQHQHTVYSLEMSCRFRMEDNICKLCWKWRSRPGVRLSASRSSPSWQTHVCISGKPLLACNNLVDYEWMIINISNSQHWCLSWITLTSIYNCDIISFPATHLCSLGGYIMGRKVCIVTPLIAI